MHNDAFSTLVEALTGEQRQVKSLFAELGFRSKNVYGIYFTMSLIRVTRTANFVT